MRIGIIGGSKHGKNSTKSSTLYAVVAALSRRVLGAQSPFLGFLIDALKRRQSAAAASKSLFKTLQPVKPV